jgi:hypothetical protein
MRAARRAIADIDAPAVKIEDSFHDGRAIYWKTGHSAKTLITS